MRPSEKKVSFGDGGFCHIVSRMVSVLRVRDQLLARLDRRRGLVLEEKTTALVLHYRRALHLQRIMESAAAALAPHYYVAVNQIAPRD